MTLEELIYTRLVQEKELQRAWQSMRAFRRCFYRKHRTTKPRGGE